MAFADHLTVDRKMNRILLVGKDPIFAWALEQKVAAMGYHLEHVYTVGEARLRMNRFPYAAVLVDGLASREANLLAQERDPQSAMFVFDDINLETAPEVQFNGNAKKAVVIPKENALSHILTTLKDLH